ncbi:Uncharacterised protein [Mycobacterium tuberculosis]|nr:Uncharacterised protein [Mycobacterium tuberculosis]
MFSPLKKGFSAKTCSDSTFSVATTPASIEPQRKTGLGDLKSSIISTPEKPTVTSV